MILLINAEKTFDKLLYVPKINMDSLCETVILLRCVQPKGVKTGVFFFLKLLHECSDQRYLKWTKTRNRLASTNEWMNA